MSQESAPAFPSSGNQQSKEQERSTSQRRRHIPDVKDMDPLAQLEFYFSPTNLLSDYYILQHLDEDQFVPVNTIYNFRRLHLMTSCVEDVVRLAEKSLALELNREKTAIRSIYYIPKLAVGIENIKYRENETPLSKDEVAHYFAEKKLPTPIEVVISRNDTLIEIIMQVEDFASMVCESLRKYPLRENLEYNVKHLIGTPIYLRIAELKPHNLLRRDIIQERKAAMESTRRSPSLPSLYPATGQLGRGAQPAVNKGRSISHPVRLDNQPKVNNIKHGGQQQLSHGMHHYFPPQDIRYNQQEQQYQDQPDNHFTHYQYAGFGGPDRHQVRYQNRNNTRYNNRSFNNDAFVQGGPPKRKSNRNWQKRGSFTQGGEKESTVVDNDKKNSFAPRDKSYNKNGKLPNANGGVSDDKTKKHGEHKERNQNYEYSRGGKGNRGGRGRYNNSRRSDRRNGPHKASHVDGPNHDSAPQVSQASQVPQIPQVPIVSLTEAFGEIQVINKTKKSGKSRDRKPRTVQKSLTNGKSNTGSVLTGGKPE